MLTLLPRCSFDVRAMMCYVMSSYQRFGEVWAILIKDVMSVDDSDGADQVVGEVLVGEVMSMSMSVNNKSMQAFAVSVLSHVDDELKQSVRTAAVEASKAFESINHAGVLYDGEVLLQHKFTTNIATDKWIATPGPPSPGCGVAAARKKVVSCSVGCNSSSACDHSLPAGAWQRHVPLAAIVSAGRGRCCPDRPCYHAASRGCVR
jgi:hypothetical protein